MPTAPLDSAAARLGDGAPAPSPRDERRNFRLGVANGGIFQAGESFIDSSTVIPVVVSSLTGSHAVIGLASALGDMGWLLPQVLVVPWASRQPRQMPMYRAAAITRALGLVAVAVSAWLLRGHPAALLAAFFAGYGLYSIGAGLGGMAFMEIVGRTVRPGRLGSFFSQRMFWGGTLGTVAALIARQVLRLDDPGTRFAILFGLAASTCSVAWVLFSTVREPAIRPTPTAAHALDLLRQGLHWLRHEPAFRRLLLARATLSVWLTASPFLTLFAVNELHGGGRAAGTLLLGRVGGFVASNLLWRRLSQRTGNRAILRVAAGLACVLMLASAVLAWASPWGGGPLSERAALLAIEVVAVLGGAASCGLIVGYAAVALETAPEGQRLSYVGVLSTFIGPTMLLPMLGGFVVDAVNAPALFLACGLVAIAGYLGASRLPAGGARPLDATLWERA